MTTRTALAARAFMESISSPGYQQAVDNAAVLGGWSGARRAGCHDGSLSDTISRAAVAAVMDLFRTWAAECERPEDS